MHIKKKHLSSYLISGFFLSAFSAPAMATQCDAYHIQVLATSISSKAEGMKKRFVDGGFDASIMSVKNNGKSLYRVRVGPYGRRAAAAKAKASLKAKYNDSVIVKTTGLCNKPTQATQCYQDLSASKGDLYAIELTIKNNKVSGYYLETHQDAHGATGKYKGVLTGNKIRASRTILVDDDVQTKNVVMTLEANAIKTGRDRFQKVACSTIKNNMTMAKEDINERLNRTDDREDQVTSSDGEVYYVTYNKYGAVIKSWNGAMLYAGKNCDTHSTLHGKGTWGFANGGFNLTFEKKNFGFPRQELNMTGIGKCRY